jgi:hypothetical protein
MVRIRAHRGAAIGGGFGNRKHNELLGFDRRRPGVPIMGDLARNVYTPDLGHGNGPKGRRKQRT